MSLIRSLGAVAGMIVFANVSLAEPPASPGREPVIYTYDARPLRRLNLEEPGNAKTVWDTLHLLSALQGIANREQPRMYLLYCEGFGIDTDRFWLDWLCKKDGWLRPVKVQPLPSVEEALRILGSSCKGLVVYDPAVPATSNLGSTAAGCEDLLPVRYDPKPGSMFRKLTEEFHFPVKLWLVQSNGAPMFTGTGLIPGTRISSTGSSKADAYLWGIERWVKTGKAATGIAAYYIDSQWLSHPTHGPTLHTLCNHDYFVGHRAFFFDLSPWGDEAPGDDPSQPPGTDKRAFLEVMHALYNRSSGSIIKVGGFIPWQHKYTSASTPAGKHDPVLTEWEFGRLISQFNGYMEADAAGLSTMANASVFQIYPLEPRYRQPNRKPGRADWMARGFLDKEGNLAGKLFVAHYVGDYDSPAWLYKAVPKFFPHNTKTPLAWAFDPNLSDRAPQAMVYARANAGTNDWFVSGDSGAGYLNARALTVRPESKLPSGLQKWARYCKPRFERWDLSITGFLLDGSAGASTETEFEAYRVFSPDGIGTHFEPAPALKASVPTCKETDLPAGPDEAALFIARTAKALKGKPGFLWGRSILKDPNWYDSVSDQLDTKHSDAAVAIVDPYTFFGLIRIYCETRPEMD